MYISDIPFSQSVQEGTLFELHPSWDVEASGILSLFTRCANNCVYYFLVTCYAEQPQTRTRWRAKKKLDF